MRGRGLARCQGGTVMRQVAVVAACLLLAACTSGHRPTPTAAGNASTPDSPSETSHPASVADSVLKCGNSIDDHPPPASFQIVLGVVALPTSPRYPALQTGLTGDKSVPRLFAKTGLIIKAGTSFDVVVPRQARGHLGIGWGGSPATPRRQVLIRNCAKAAGNSDWLAYAGGYWIDHPACVAIVVKAQGQQERLHIGLGTPCHGQQPPRGPSDR
jgi:hypothetical protein